MFSLEHRTKKMRAELSQLLGALSVVPATVSAPIFSNVGRQVCVCVCHFRVVRSYQLVAHRLGCLPSNVDRFLPN